MRTILKFKTPAETLKAAGMGGVAKANLSTGKLLVLGFLAGAFIAFGGALAIIVGGGCTTLATTDPGMKKFIFGGVFPVGLLLVVIAGAELFTGNTACLAPSLLAGDITIWQVLRNWGLVYIGNFVGSLFVAYFLMYKSELVTVDPWKTVAINIAYAKLHLGYAVLIFRGIGCNWLVCLAVWLAIASNEIAGKIWGIWFPIMAFVAVGFEHSVANMFFIPLGLMLGAEGTFWDFLFNNLIPVTIGNIIGGSILVGGLYWWLYMYHAEPKPEREWIRIIVFSALFIIVLFVTIFVAFV